ncbi:MAG: hypothetical protein A3G39_00830 [Deltaproteobacteria bacterium RIFCSPLOWO2_12_FULL_43_16]|nr:MAG: hypothetical protein A2Z89_02305 [Deltaproteobacteria bacterium GWA2_43_19]OGQ09815.1 MAG: hypothetical protein A3D30_07900 [Deltaproteobacteria bacterium RIFCSPHIGHO2_02_FULL_43_33]OGQ58338.1 MAG: hypothetical protein A3G39_00830 [Deltaproteobacteria bacterium RIFCSPLOWO2_12_FULL_43_16]
MSATTACYYFSPEQAGLLNQGVDERSDLYSAGIVLFECLAGRPPFCGSSIGEILRQHLTVQPTIVRTLRSDIPRALAEVIHRLLQKDPRDRYQSAFALKRFINLKFKKLSKGVKKDKFCGLFIR